VSAFAAVPGELIVQRPGPELPAATAITMPASCAAFTATAITSVPLPQPVAPSDRFAASIPYVARLVVTQSMPAAIVLSEPDPAPLSTFTPTSDAPGATPR
jgi:hypothetical protein